MRLIYIRKHNMNNLSRVCLTKKQFFWSVYLQTVDRNVVFGEKVANKCNDIFKTITVTVNSNLFV